MLSDARLDALIESFDKYPPQHFSMMAELAQALRHYKELRAGVDKAQQPLAQCNCKAGAYDTHDEGCPLN